MASLFLGIFAPDFFKEWFVRIIFYGVSASFVVWLVFAVLWWPSLWEQIICSFLVWSVAISINISFKTVCTLLIYGVAIVLQITIVLWWLLKRAYGIKKEKWRMLPQKRKRQHPFLESPKFPLPAKYNQTLPIYTNENNEDTSILMEKRPT